MLRKLTIKNYKSIYNITVDLVRTNVFIGENGCGKTNILEALAMRGIKLERQINAALFERSIVSKQKLSAVPREIQPDIDEAFKDNSRNISPTLVAQYHLQLPDKKLIRAKLHELMEKELAAKNKDVGEDE